MQKQLCNSISLSQGFNAIIDPAKPIRDTMSQNTKHVPHQRLDSENNMKFKGVQRYSHFSPQVINARMISSFMI